MNKCFSNKNVHISPYYFTGTLEDFVIFYDYPSQIIRIGHTYDTCFMTRVMLTESIVTGHTAHVVIDLSDQFLWVTINDETFAIRNDILTISVL